MRDEKLFIYAGKIGSWYLIEETFSFFRVARKRVGTARLLILTGDPPEAFSEAARRSGVDKHDFDVRHANHQEVAEWLSAADAGLAFIRQVRSKRGSSPVKVGEYLAVGLPVVITSGIGDYSSLIEREQLGAVINSLTTEEYLETADRLLTLWSEGAGLRERCRRVAESHASLDTVGATRYQSIYQYLLRGRHAPPGSRPSIPVLTRS